MTIAGTVNLNGIDALFTALGRELDQPEIIEKGLRKGAGVLRAAVHDNLVKNGLVDTGLLSSTLRIVRKETQLPGKYEVVVKASGQLSMVVRKGQSRETRARPAKYANFGEYGTENEPARPSFRPALDQKGQEAGRVAGDEITAQLVKLARAKVLKAG